MIILLLLGLPTRNMKSPENHEDVSNGIIHLSRLTLYKSWTL